MRGGIRRLGRGFTLVEMLVVVAVIALLLSILLPAFSAARDATKAAVCQSRLRQIGQSLLTYFGDNEGYIPRGDNYIWYDVVMVYVSSDTEGEFWRVPLFRCPKYPDPEQSITYVVSAWTFASRKDKTGRQIMAPTKLAFFDRPGSTIYLADNESGWWRPIVPTREASTWHLPDGTWESGGITRNDVWQTAHLPASDREDVTNGRRVARARHGEGCNVLNVDGSAGWIAADAMTVDDWRDRWRE